jgi:hypothetical protein
VIGMSAAAGLRARVSADNQELRIERASGGHLLTHRVFAGQRPSIHPINAPDGVGILTEDSPSHHPWQHGLYTGFNLVNGIGFWRERPEDGTFHPRLATAPVADGPTVHWSLETIWRATDQTDLITERQEWTIVDEGPTFDLTIGWELCAEVDVEVGQYMAGGLFLRMPYVKERGGAAVNSDGLINGEAEKRRARWVAVSMPIDGRTDWAGMAIMDHPTNPAHPVTWRVDNELGISPSRCIAESWAIRAGDVDRYRYRIHVFCGVIDAEAIDRRWQAFAD